MRDLSLTPSDSNAVAEIIPFNFNSHSVRVVPDESGAPWFVAMDVAAVLDYSDTFEMTKRLDEDEKQNRQVAGFGPRGITLINESGVFAAVLGSKKLEAKPFRRWVTKEVLPTIRKTGSYGVAPALPDFTNPIIAARAWADAQEARLIAERTKAEIGSRREATAMNTAAQATRKANKLWTARSNMRP